MSPSNIDDLESPLASVTVSNLKCERNLICYPSLQTVASVTLKTTFFLAVTILLKTM